MTKKCNGISNKQYLCSTPSVPFYVTLIPFWDVPKRMNLQYLLFLNTTFHYYTHYFLPLSLFYNNINTITPTIFLHYLKSIIKYW